MDSRRHAIIDRLRRTPFWRPVRGLVRTAMQLLVRLGLRQSEDQLQHDAQAYWTGDALHAPNMFHWRGSDGFSDEVYARMGERNVARFRRFAAALDFPTADLRVLEWGCGGGALLRAFAVHASQLIGVDISPESLDRSVTELVGTGVPFEPILVTVEAPEAALDRLDDPVDLFVCINVMELLPSNGYGVRMLQLAERALRPGGMAIVQIRYTTDDMASRPTRAFYRANTTRMAAYRLDEFWVTCQRVGLIPQLLTIEPEEEIIGDRYAYYALLKQSTDTAGA